MNRIVEKVVNGVLLAVVAYFAIGVLRNMASTGGVVAIFAALSLFPFVLGPVLIHQTQRISLKPALFPFDPDGPESPEELQSHFDATAAELGRLEFSPERYYRTRRAATNADGSVLLFRNVKTWETARVLTAVGVSNTARIVTSFVVFGSEFADGTEVVTSNRASARIYPPRKPPYHGRAFPQVREVDRLLVVHRARVENLAAGRIAVDQVGVDPDGYIRRVDFEVPSAHHVACGYSYVDEMAGVQRMTWKGAILSTWKLLPPIKQIRLAWERLMAARQLSNLKGGLPVG
ncbi:MAG: hypothetical protein P4L85_13140 [Paludisphaera borealis]|uniref:hypothetical protein n=1 Tax=Paludisphaera borealis TaxID=1387353 RepID=UPI00283D147A|nr:hypothetical protein [Paludisphaera borealis]MDR3620289.1 hypothetical protein [Paludisphaera borealis]